MNVLRAKRADFFPYIYISTFLLLGGWALNAGAAEVFTVGGSQRAWKDFGATPGGVIDFVENLGRLQKSSGERVFGEAPDSLRGWITPLRLRPDFNISLGILKRGGSIDVPNLTSTQKNPAQLEGLLNGDHKVAFDRKFIEGRVIRNNGLKIRIDLGAQFGVNRIVFFPRMSAQFPFENDFLRGYELFLNDGLPENLFASGQPIFSSPVVREIDNDKPVVEILIEPQFVRFAELKALTFLGFEIDEIELYGTGFVPKAQYVSNVLDLDEPMVWGRINWTEVRAGVPDKSRVEVRVRSGRDPTPDIYFRTVPLGGGKSELVPTDSRGDTLTQKSYELLRENERGPIRVDAANWSQWQLAANRDKLNLPAPRRYFQFRIDFTNQSLDASRAIADLGFEFAPPPVDRLVAEVSPARTRAGDLTTFTYIAQVSNTTGRPGFERFEIETPARVAAIHSVEIQDRRSRRLAGAEFGTSLEQVPIRVGDFAIEKVEDNHFTLGLPRISEDGTRLKIVFEAAAFRFGTRFQGRAFIDAQAELPLLTEAGDASPELDTNGLLVRVSLGSKITGSLDIRPAVFTPNGDGVNDTVEIIFTVLHLLQPSATEVSVYDLAGRRVRQLSSSRVQNGRFPLRWDGRRDDGELVPPGLYVVAIKVRSDRKTERRAGSVAVVY